MPEPDLYRNRDFIPDFDEIMAETQARSHALAARSRMERDIAYGPAARQTLDLVFPPGTVSGAPLHMFVHGGYWRAGSKQAHTLVAAPVLAAGGIAALVNYALMPGTRLAEIVDQVRSAARHLVTLAPGIGADPDRFTASGHSAGAHLASLLAAKAPGDDSFAPLAELKGLLLVSGIYDLSGIPDSFLRHEAKMTPTEAEAWSPLSAQPLPGPLRIITRGQHETAPFQTQAITFDALTAGAGSRTELRQEAGRNHLTILLDLANPRTSLGTRLADLVAKS
jgi:arylformamidase